MKSLGEIVKFEDNVQALMDLGIGRLDAVVVDEILGRYYISKKKVSTLLRPTTLPKKSTASVSVKLIRPLPLR